MRPGLTHLRSAVKVGVSSLVVVVLVVGVWAQVPASYQPPIYSHGPDTVDELQATGADIESRLVPDEEVFSMYPTYYVLADRDHAFTSRVWILVDPHGGAGYTDGYDDTYRAAAVRQGLVERFDNGTVGLVLMTPRTSFVIRYWPSVHDAFRSNYCRVEPRPALYDQYNVSIYEWTGNTTGPDCASEIVVEYEMEELPNWGRNETAS